MRHDDGPSWVRDVSIWMIPTTLLYACAPSAGQGRPAAASHRAADDVRGATGILNYEVWATGWDSAYVELLGQDGALLGSIDTVLEGDIPTLTHAWLGGEESFLTIQRADEPAGAHLTERLTLGATELWIESEVAQDASLRRFDVTLAQDGQPIDTMALADDGPTIGDLASWLAAHPEAQTLLASRAIDVSGRVEVDPGYWLAVLEALGQSAPGDGDAVAAADDALPCDAVEVALSGGGAAAAVGLCALMIGVALVPEPLEPGAGLLAGVTCGIAALALGVSVSILIRCIREHYARRAG
jgi:hypothetical protein